MFNVLQTVCEEKMKNSSLTKVTRREREEVDNEQTNFEFTDRRDTGHHARTVIFSNFVHYYLISTYAIVIIS